MLGLVQRHVSVSYPTFRVRTPGSKARRTPALHHLEGVHSGEEMSETQVWYRPCGPPLQQGSAVNSALQQKTVSVPNDPRKYLDHPRKCSAVIVYVQ